MCLRKSPARTPAFLSANRRNAQKCTGPKTRAGKARSSLNALKHGAYAGRLPKRLDAAGMADGLALWKAAYQTISTSFQVETDRQREQARWFANRVFALGWRASLFGTKPECGLFSERLASRSLALFPIRIHERYSRTGLTFWIQRKGYWTLPKLVAAVFGGTGLERDLAFGFRKSPSPRPAAPAPSRVSSPEPPAPSPQGPPPLRLALEGRMRCRTYRMRAPRSAWERRKYGIGPVGPGLDPASHQADSSVGPAPSTELEKVQAILRAAPRGCSPHQNPVNDDGDGIELVSRRRT